MSSPQNPVLTQAALRAATGPGLQFAGVTDKLLRQLTRPAAR
jgi:hypothetical protein